MEPLSKELADKIIAGIKAVDGVADMHSGRFGEVVTLYPGGRISGLRLREYPHTGETRCEVYIVADLAATPSLNQVTDSVRSVVSQYLTCPVDITVADAVAA